MAKIIKPISKHPILNVDRAIKVKQIAYIDFDLQEAKITWEEVLLDETGKEIKDETLATRKMVSHISNANKVDQNGIVIDEDNFPKQETETDEQYQERLNKLKKAGFSEFDFYINAVLNVPAIGQAIEVLDNLKRFNRK